MERIGAMTADWQPRAKAEEFVEQRADHGADAADGRADEGDGAEVELLGFLLRRGLGLVRLGNGGGGGADLGLRLGIGGGGALGDLLLDETDEFFVRRPERLADADRVVDDLRDRRVPVVARAVVEHAVAPHHERVAVAVREHGADRLLVSARARDVAVGEIGAGEARERSVLAGICHLEAEVAAARVEVERSRLEHGARAAVEVGEVHRVRQQLVEILLEAQQLLDGRDLVELRLERGVMANQRRDVRTRGAALGAAVFARGEGMWFGNNEVFFACTNGGLTQRGQVFRYRPSPAEGTPGEGSSPGTLELYLEPNNSALLEGCDNVMVAPWGDLIICEDNAAPAPVVGTFTGSNYLRGVTPDGKIYTLGRNRYLGISELAGIAFAPNHPTMFVNIQVPGLTLAITGPWENLKKGPPVTPIPVEPPRPTTAPAAT